MPRSMKFLLSICAAAALLGAATASADTPPTWHFDLHHNETNFAPGETGEYWFEPINIGGTPTSGPVTIRTELPAGLTVDNVRKIGSFPNYSWTCDAVTGASTVSCTTEDSIGPHTMSTGLILTVDVAADASGVLDTVATIEGGGPEPVTDVEPTQISPQPAGFGIVPGSFKSAFTAWDEKTPATQAGSHPDLANFSFDFNSVDDPSPRWPDDPWQKASTEPIRDLEVELPAGFLGNPTAVAECTPAQLGEGKCPRGSQVGRMDLTLFAAPPNAYQQFNAIHSAVYNMVHPRGAIADLAFSAAGNPVHIRASLDPANNYAVRTTVSDINESLPPFHQKLTLWGVPIDHLHDWERCSDYGSIPWEVTTPCQTDASQKPFLTVPSDCGTDHVFTLRRYDSWVHTGIYGPDLTYPSPRSTGCDKPRFEPDVAVHPTTQTANSPTGLDVHVQVPQNESPHGLATPPVKRFVVTFPEGMTVSPSFATGLQGCSLSQIGFGTDDPVGCPDASRIGSVDLSTPLLPQPLEGSMYLSNQKENPSGTTFGLYIAVHDTEERGVLMKLPGKLELDQRTGQITTTFDEVPQFPFDDLTLKFRSGPRAPLVSPPTCGKQTIGVDVTSWAQPDTPVDVSNTFGITEGPNGTPCPARLDKRPFAPKLEAGVVNPIAATTRTSSSTLPVRTPNRRWTGSRRRCRRGCWRSSPASATAPSRHWHRFRAPKTPAGKSSHAPPARPRARSARSTSPWAPAARRSTSAGRFTSPVRTRERRSRWRLSLPRSRGRSTSGPWWCGRRSTSIPKAPRSTSFPIRSRRSCTESCCGCATSRSTWTARSPC
jgi:hypothetical protein